MSSADTFGVNMSLHISLCQSVQHDDRYATWNWTLVHYQYFYLNSKHEFIAYLNIEAVEAFAVHIVRFTWPQTGCDGDVGAVYCPNHPGEA